MVVLLISRTLAEASCWRLKADLILRICWLLFPIFVNMSINRRNPPIIADGTRIFTDLAKNKYTTNPAIKVIIAVLVPDWNIPQITIAVVNMKKILSNLILEVIPKIKNAIADALALHPYVAASLKVDQYLINVPAFNK